MEVPRYLFYACNLFMKKVPTPLFFLRYNLFMALYPSGISGAFAHARGYSPALLCCDR